jgi:hypothetical protein
MLLMRSGFTMLVKLHLSLLQNPWLLPRQQGGQRLCLTFEDGDFEPWAEHRDLIIMGNWVVAWNIFYCP